MRPGPLLPLALLLLHNCQSAAHGAKAVHVSDAVLGKTYANWVADNNEFHYVFHLGHLSFPNDAVRLSTQVLAAPQNETQLSFHVRHSNGNLQWYLPKKTGLDETVSSLERTLCLGAGDALSDVTVVVSSQSERHTHFRLALETVPDFSAEAMKVNSVKNVTVSFY